MIINFKLKNWRSFRDETEFSMIASKERQHGERIPKVAKYPIRILPITSIYGGNASGKSNLFDALYFMRWMVLSGPGPDRRIPIERFMLSQEMKLAPASFEIEILVNDVIYAYSFAVTDKEVISEQLVRTSSAGDTMLFDRKNKSIEFDIQDAKDDFIKFVFKGTRSNQLFLASAIAQNVDKYRPVYDWFSKKLLLVKPDAKFARFEHFLSEKSFIYEQMNEMLYSLDTGIRHLHGQEISLDSLGLSDSMLRELEEKIDEGNTVRIEQRYDRIIVLRQDGVLKAKKLMAVHLDDSGNEVVFEMKQESDGTLRIIDLLPAFLMLNSDDSFDKVVVIDELDRSLHSQLVRKLIEFYMESCNPQSRSQLLFTTHDLLLMTQDLFRRDEMWVVERDQEGVSELIAFSEYNDIRYDKDIMKSYLQGRMGGLPHLSLTGQATGMLEDA